MFPRDYDDLPGSVIIALYEQAYSYYLSRVETAEIFRDGSLKFHDDKIVAAEFGYEMAIINIEDQKQKSIINAESSGRTGRSLKQTIREINTTARKSAVRAKFDKNKTIKKAEKNKATVLKRYPRELAATTKEARQALNRYERYAPIPTKARPGGVSLPPKSY